MGQKKNVDMTVSEDKVKVVEAPTPEPKEAETKETPEKKKTKTTKQKKLRSKKYRAVRSQVDKTRFYDPFSAIELVKKLSYSSFPGTIVADVVLGEKFQGERFNLKFPHSTGKTLTVAIADDKILKKVEVGKIEFDVLLATPNMMPKLAKLAKILGPRGLMPNPKQGTLIANPEEKQKELESGNLTIKSEPKAPLIHLVIGNTEMETKQLVENLQALIDTLKGKIQKVSLSATMSPSVKVVVEK